MNNRDLAASLNIGPSFKQIALAPDDGSIYVVAAYCVGQSSLLVPDETTFRDPGSPIWYIWVRPRIPGDGPSYAIPEFALARFVGPSARPNETDMDKLRAEESHSIIQGVQLDADTRLAFGQAPRNTTATLVADYKELAAKAPATLGGYLGHAAAGIVRGAATVAGDVVGGALGALPSWLLVGAILIGAGAITVGAVSLARRVQ